MAELTTTVHSDRDSILAMPGRIPRQQAIETARYYLQKQIENAQYNLERLNTWYTTTERGSVKALTYEEVEHGSQ